MARNGRERQTREDLRREAANRLAAVKRTAAALEDRLRERSEQVSEAVDRTRDRLHRFDDVVHRHRYAFIGGALGLGLVLGRRRRPRRLELGAGGDTRYILVERAPRPGVVRSVLGGLAALALRHGMSWLVSRLDTDDPDDRREPYLLPNERRAERRR
jgi:ElaB/YqjD/DUF883 family membrane-anchored ribosome-binding protein